MSILEYRVELLGTHHDRSTFSCGHETLDRYLRQQARQDTAKRVAQDFVLIHISTSRLAGFYSLSAFSVRAAEFPVEMTRRLPRYPRIPTTMLGRLAVDRQFRGQGLGGILLLDALRRSRDVSRTVASVAVIVDAKDDSARSFYEHFEFKRFVSDEYRLFLAMGSIEDL
ncbi:MAG TPA: GNAT family N-acetyltransferase [Thermomicrobiaceae bacterium]|nr:GNAT family N-acetyltransferase [Thermomicrobiaceae bacterium]